MRAVFPVTLNLLVGGESHEPMQLFVALRVAVKKRDIESNDQRQRGRSPSLKSYPVIDNDMRAVIPVTLNLLVGGENYELMQLFASGLPISGFVSIQQD
ncbi:hypothetical protein KIN20_015415 [Parelaphostrongylus tenuis]|uniref:Uncharacterized protein n=1 Tax=Parelaphostrongylus tenuis TaxID=148309 RepID=A0AAD5MXB5_PARTN|nr:hypothetical protein KIN20_015415 [Parelaphostrongylus tenuis]